MKIRLVQSVVEQQVETNLQKILRHIKDASIGECLIFPEAMLSGYAPEEDTYLSSLNQRVVDEAIVAIREASCRRNCAVIVGSATSVGRKWFNSVIMTQGSNDDEASVVHDKRELSQLDKQHFEPGSHARIHQSGSMICGFQACRELLFPDTWSRLRREGASIIFHLNNALKPQDAIWEHILIARAVENTMFVCSVNNAADPQSLGSYMIAPDGSFLVSMKPQREYSECVEIDLSSVAPWGHERKDF